MKFSMVSESARTCYDHSSGRLIVVIARSKDLATCAGLLCCLGLGAKVPEKAWPLFFIDSELSKILKYQWPTLRLLNPSSYLCKKYNCWSSQNASDQLTALKLRRDSNFYCLLTS